MKNHLFIILFLVLTCRMFAQSDSTLFMNGSWQNDTIDGLVVRQCMFDGRQLFHSNQQFFVLEVSDTTHYALKFSCRPQRTKTSVMAMEEGAVAAVNGSFFDMDKHFPVCYLRVDGVNLGENTPEEDSLYRRYTQYGTLCLVNDSAFILKSDTLRVWEDSLPYPDIMTAGPLLIDEGDLLATMDELPFSSQRHNRTAVGIRDDGTVLLVVADGRAKEAEGLSLYELQQVMCWLGCSSALNLDGGGSTTFFMDLGDHHGVMNCPSDNGVFDHEGERGVSNAILIVRKTKDLE